MGWDDEQRCGEGGVVSDLVVFVRHNNNDRGVREASRGLILARRYSCAFYIWETSMHLLTLLFDMSVVHQETNMKQYKTCRTECERF